MEKLINILKHHNVKEFEVAEMIHTYLSKYGESDDPLTQELYETYLK